ncbi:hypothetical protein D5045_20190 [Verminephrobacter eiseniae]|nr:hypothetical protein [Verminephrobacter eiseniae]
MFTPLHCLALVAALTLAGCAAAEPAVSAPSYFLSTQDGRAALLDGVGVVDAAKDKLAVVEESGGKLRIVNAIVMPVWLMDPPSSIALVPAGRLALVSTATRRDPVDPTRVIAFDLVSVAALDPSGMVPPRAVAALHTGVAGISINRAGTLALVANRGEGSVSLLAIDGERVETVAKLMLGEKAGPAHAACTPDGRQVLVQDALNRQIRLYRTDGNQVCRHRRAPTVQRRAFGPAALALKPITSFGSLRIS